MIGDNFLPTDEDINDKESAAFLDSLRQHSMPKFSTPMMKQYAEIKNQYKDCLLFYRMGDFYELFMEDAIIGASILDITLTSRNEGKDGRVPMAGVPYHAVDSYLAKLVKAGHKVAICEQLSEPNKKGLVERDVIRIVTPGTLLDEKVLNKKENNYIVSIVYDSHSIGLSYADLSTGNMQTFQIPFTNLEQILTDELAKLQPSECIISPKDYENAELLKILKNQKGLNIYPFNSWEDVTGNAKEFLKDHFKVTTIESFGIEDKPLTQIASAALIGYLKLTQKDHIGHIKKITLLSQNDYVILDKSTMINLELFSTIREHDTKGTLLAVLDETQTAMGGRMLRNWITKPLAQMQPIIERYDAIQVLLDHPNEQKALQELLKEVPDIERITSRLAVGIGNGRDLLNLKLALKKILQIKEHLQTVHNTLLTGLQKQISEDLVNIVERIDQILVDNPPISLREGELIKPGIHKELDKLRKKIGNSKQWIVELETKERQRTGINSLKVRFNKVFGFYIEISKANIPNVPDDYIRKQTLVNGERFITPELKEQEALILSSETAINEIEYQLFQELLSEVIQSVDQIQRASNAIANIDVLSNFALIAQKKRYTRPKIMYSGEIRIKAGRHPVVETLLENAQFIPNDILLNKTTHQLLIITGPNMAGKSVLIRQIALIVLMAQIGCFVPADSAFISLVDKIFVRSGASDVITSGLSTFMVEMMETAHILNHATQDSLIIMDEIGRGTSTYDGISIAWAVADYLVTEKDVNPKTLFATHYHELQALENEYPNKIKNYHMAVQNSSGDPVFLHTLLPGPASHSFGVAVAKLAGIPSPIIDKALNILKSLETRDIDQVDLEKALTTTPGATHTIIEKIKSADIAHMTPIEALNFLAQLQNETKS